RQRVRDPRERCEERELHGGAEQGSAVHCHLLRRRAVVRHLRLNSGAEISRAKAWPLSAAPRMPASVASLTGPITDDASRSTSNPLPAMPPTRFPTAPLHSIRFSSASPPSQLAAVSGQPAGEPGVNGRCPSSFRNPVICCKL